MRLVSKPLPALISGGPGSPRNFLHLPIKASLAYEEDKTKPTHG